MTSDTISEMTTKITSHMAFDMAFDMIFDMTFDMTCGRERYLTLICILLLKFQIQSLSYHSNYLLLNWSEQVRWTNVDGLLSIGKFPITNVQCPKFDVQY